MACKCVCANPATEVWLPFERWTPADISAVIGGAIPPIAGQSGAPTNVQPVWVFIQGQISIVVASIHRSEVRDWVSFDMSWFWTNLSGAAGDVFAGVAMAHYADTDDLSDLATTVTSDGKVVPAPALNELRITDFAGSIIGVNPGPIVIPTGDEFIELAAGRGSGVSFPEDTLAGDVGLLGVKLTRVI